MKKKFIAATILLSLSATLTPIITVHPILAQETTDYAETTDFSKISGSWRNADSSAEETLTITDDGLFVYHTKETGDTQGYLVYTDEYNVENGRYDMYNRIGIWLSGFYLDSDTSLHMGNIDNTVFTRIEKKSDDINEQQEHNSQSISYVLTSNKRYTGLKTLYNDSSWNGGYFYSDMTQDSLTVIVNCSTQNDEKADGNTKKFRKQFASLVSDCKIKNYKENQNKKLTKKFSYPVYNLSFTTGTNEDTCKWKMIFFQTDTNTYAYAYKMNADNASEMTEEYNHAINSLDLIKLSDSQGASTGENDYDPSADGKSLEMFISYFDTWYQYGDLNATSIHLFGDGSWEIYNSKNADGSGGYLFDSGILITSDTIALQLYSSDGSHVANVSLNENDELTLSPVVSGYGNIYAGAAFSRESQSVAYEAQTAADENDYYEKDGKGDYIPDDYVEESDPGDTYYWYDDEGDIMFFNGYEDVYIGTGDIYYIDDSGQLCEY